MIVFKFILIRKFEFMMFELRFFTKIHIILIIKIMVMFFKIYLFIFF